MPAWNLRKTQTACQCWAQRRGRHQLEAWIGAPQQAVGDRDLVVRRRPAKVRRETAGRGDDPVPHCQGGRPKITAADQLRQGGTRAGDIGSSSSRGRGWQKTGEDQAEQRSWDLGNGCECVLDGGFRLAGRLALADSGSNRRGRRRRPLMRRRRERNFRRGHPEAAARQAPAALHPDCDGRGPGQAGTVRGHAEERRGGRGEAAAEVVAQGQAGQFPRRSHLQRRSSGRQTGNVIAATSLAEASLDVPATLSLQQLRGRRSALRLEGGQRPAQGRSLPRPRAAARRARHAVPAVHRGAPVYIPAHAAEGSDSGGLAGRPCVEGAEGSARLRQRRRRADAKPSVGGIQQALLARHQLRPRPAPAPAAAAAAAAAAGGPDRIIAC
mmetsp:Transcript_106593/g.340057  ORF Transcript_106593/g.340057 Transcript_106593/m.340057 type:complete len:383 (+) Transcript_106593:742-1890(+)